MAAFGRRQGEGNVNKSHPRGRPCPDTWFVLELARHEGRMPEQTIKALERRGHIVKVEADWSEGRLTAASREGRRRQSVRDTGGCAARR
jgi:hypothetical protein